MTWLSITVFVKIYGKESACIAFRIIYFLQLGANGSKIGCGFVRGIIIPTEISLWLDETTVTRISRTRQHQRNGTAILIDVIIIFHLYCALHAALVEGRVGNAEIMCKSLGISPRHAQHGKDSECPCRAESRRRETAAAVI